MELVTPSNGLLAWQLGGFLVFVGYFGFTIYALIDMVRSDFRDQHMKLIWALIILMIPVIGTFLYLSMNRRTKRNHRKFNPNFSSHSKQSN
ncbi:PLD nuclease N-terminal domain-containing protein [Algoriphagus sp.]|uniref:PLD nuclease N-terminal domain-containing protein n=1 Tax=Algoriphagus sp. TaxID=1872435 RepID=UPI0025FAE31D|nr:PLD nuclease N-terminal domain-containing protein [Algoriphagus sp.]